MGEIEFISQLLELGVTGIAIGGLMSIIIFIIRIHFRTHKEMMDMHRKERQEWREECNKRHDETNQILRELREVIRNSK